MDSIPLRLMKDRRYELLPIDRIIILNSRDREQERFSDNVQSIQNVGLLKPVLVNERFYKKTEKYELVCGEGRFIAHQRLGKAEIAAEVIDCDRKEAYLISLIENIARVPAGTMWFAHEMKRMRDAGMTFSEIGRIVGKVESYVIGYIQLVEKGEERLIRGVEHGIFPITFAMQVAASDEAGIQNLLMDAFDSSLVTTTNIRRVRGIIMDRIARLGYQRKPTVREPGGKAAEYTVAQLKRDIAKTCREKDSFVHEAEQKEGRLVCLVEGLKTLRADADFMKLLKAEGQDELPQLKGLYKV